MASLMLTSCSEAAHGPPKDCAVAKQQFRNCADKYLASGDADGFEGMWYSCIPHSEPKIIEGSWATDFEWNAFFEGRQPTPQEAFPADYLPPTLAFKDGVEAPPGSSGSARLWAIKFIGREQTCRLFENTEPTFFVERILDQKLVWEAQGYPNSSLEPATP
tara:strand:- start:33 stop:515 length:483 start_codon:yes stop_codon:yes gene_type:complete